MYSNVLSRHIDLNRLDDPITATVYLEQGAPMVQDYDEESDSDQDEDQPLLSRDGVDTE